jgi:hypothetical protein
MEQCMSWEIGQRFEIQGNPWQSFALGAPLLLQPAGGPSQMFANGMPASMYGSVGADPMATLAPAPAGTLPPQVPMSRGPMVVREKPPTEPRLFPVPLNTSGLVTANGGTDDAIVQPQELTKPRRYVVSKSIAADFMLRVTIGVKPQTSANGMISAEAFLGDVIASDVDWDTCDISQQIDAFVQNIGGADKRFLSTMYCYVAR